MSTDTEEHEPMLNSEAETASDPPVEVQPPESQAAQECSVDEPPVSTDATSESVEGSHKGGDSSPPTTVRGDPASSPVSSPVSSPASGDKPIKPPRMKSMRSKDGSPLLKEQKSLEAKSADVETAPAVQATPPAYEKMNPEALPYLPTTVSLHTDDAAVKPKKKLGLDCILGNKWILLGIIAVVLIILIIIIVGVSVSRPRKVAPTPQPVYEDPIVMGLRCGKAVGSWELNETVAVFKGIPYLKPPVGSNRWTYNLEMSAISDCDNATNAKEFKGPCFQLNQLSNDPKYIGSEDCLYLNIWTPASPSTGGVMSGAKLPVLVYIHGGFLHYGSGHEDGFSPSAELATELNAVIVSFNYRLNVFGWMALENLASGDGKMSGNFGLYDQISALKWINEYIDNFGGNPEMVTVAGLSSGGTSILALLTNDEAKATFQRAWISGASSKFDGSKADTMKVNKKVFLRNVGCRSEENNPRQCLLRKTSEQLVDAIPWLQYPSWGAKDLVEPPTKDTFIGGVLINDEQYVLKAPDEFFKTSVADLEIPILMGNNEFESDMYQVVPVSTWSWGQYSDYVRSKYDTFNESISDFVLNSYAPSLSDSTRLHLARHVSDLRAICPQTFLAATITDNTNSAVYRYVNTVNLPQKLTDIYQASSTVATHGSEFFHFFHFSEDDSDDFISFKQNFTAVIKEFMVNGMITGWAHYPVVYEYSKNGPNKTSRWTADACDAWRAFYPDYSWMN